jgi:hypothetical protein
MNQLGQDAIAVAIEDIRSKVIDAERFLAEEDGEAAFEILRFIHTIADRTINRMIVDRLIEAKP